MEKELTFQPFESCGNYRIFGARVGIGPFGIGMDKPPTAFRRARTSRI